MSDKNDMVYRMRRAVGMGAMVECLDEGADEIERLRALLREASAAKTWGDAQAIIDAALGDRHE